MSKRIHVTPSVSLAKGAVLASVAFVILSAAGCTASAMFPFQAFDFTCDRFNVQFTEQNTMNVHKDGDSGSIISAPFRVIEGPTEHGGRWAVRLDFETSTTLNPMFGSSPNPTKLYLRQVGSYGIEMRTDNAAGDRVCKKQFSKT